MFKNQPFTRIADDGKDNISIPSETIIPANQPEIDIHKSWPSSPTTASPIGMQSTPAQQAARISPETGSSSGFRNNAPSTMNDQDCSIIDSSIADRAGIR